MVWLYNFCAMFFPFLISDYIELKCKLDFLQGFAVSLLILFLSQTFIMPLKGEFFSLEVLSALVVAALLSNKCSFEIIEQENQN